MSWQTLAAIDDVVDFLTREFPSVTMSNLRQVWRAITGFLFGIGSVALRVSAVAPRTIVSVFAWTYPDSVEGVGLGKSALAE